MSFDPERDELEAVLSAGIFERHSNLGRLLSYLCDRRFEGESDQVKEYNIALDVFGRPPDFDKRRDSIVRVEASRLRRKLKDYYAGAGRGRALQITLPAGQYVPEFVARVPDEPPEPEKTLRGRWPAGERIGSRRIWLGAAALALAVLAVVAAQNVRSSPLPAVAAARTPSMASAAAPPPGQPLRILCGYPREQYVDRYGRAWLGDRFYSGGDGLDRDRGPIARTLDPNLFHSMRSGTAFRYDIPLQPGLYELRLHFAETQYLPDQVSAGDNQRVLAISINSPKPTDFIDVVASAGGVRTATTRVYTGIRPAADGLLHLGFGAINGNAVLNGIEVLPSAGEGMRAVRLATRQTGYTDSAGQVWSADNYYSGGQMITRNLLMPGNPDSDLYTSERFGNFSYNIPVAPRARYQVKLRFAETFFVDGEMARPGVRLFNVYCNGRFLLREFDVNREAGGPLRPVERVFRNIEPNALGHIHLTFEPVRNYALVNAIEVTQQ